MDTNIRNLLNICKNNTGTKRDESLEEIVKILRTVDDTKSPVDGPDSFSPDLFVQTAEVAFNLGHVQIADECLKLYFAKPVPSNQFYGRAYLLQAQILAPTTATNSEQLDKALVYLLKAIKFAKESSRYHFLVFNSSVIYWKFCRPFLKVNYRQYLAKSLHQVVQALDDIEDKDYEWRATLMISLIECHLDAGRRQDATNIALAAAGFIRQYVPDMYKKVFGLMIRHKLVDAAKLGKDLKIPELAVFYKICKIKTALENGETGDYQIDIQLLLSQLGLTTDLPDLTSVSSNSQESKTSKRTRTTTQSVAKSPDDDRKSPVKGGRRTPTPTSAKKVALDSPDRCKLMLEVARLASNLKYVDLACLAANSLMVASAKDPGLQLEVEFLQSELMVRKLGVLEDSYASSAVDLRMKAIRRCEASILNAIRQNLPNVIQAGCMCQWNLCLLLLQPHTRRLVRKHLTVIADALQAIDSLLMHVRCEIHTELAVCEEEEDQIEVAIDHLNKAVTLDNSQMYSERLQASLHRLHMRAQLYHQPDRSEDVTAMIIEQARTADSGTMLMKRSLLMKAGESLAPDAFTLVLDSEVAKELSGGKGSQIEMMSDRAQRYNRSVEKAGGHLKRLGSECDRERARLWADLTKTARKQEVWDVCRVAARFCLLYDDGRWKRDVSETIKSESSKAVIPKIKSDLGVDVSEDTVLSRAASPDSGGMSPDDRDLIRMLAEINFINGEAFIQLLRGEHVELNNKPIPPEDKSKKPKGYVAKRPEDDPNWIIYCEWIDSLSAAATNSFLRALQLGIDLREEWIICSASTYIYNYNHHLLIEGRHPEIREHLGVCFEALKTVGHTGETTMLVNIANALCLAFVKPWIPEKEISVSPNLTKGKKTGTATGKSKLSTRAIDPEGLNDVKHALEACDHVLQVTSGDAIKDIVPIYERQNILQSWALARQMAQMPIAKSLGTDDEMNNERQRPMTRAIIAVEMHFLNRNGMIEFKETPPLQETARLIEESLWTDTLVELQLWARLTYLAHDNNLPDLVKHCSSKALRFTNISTFTASTTISRKHKKIVECEMMSNASGILGQSLYDNMKGRNSVRREAMEAFLNSARFACKASNRSQVMNAAKQYWNAGLTLLSSPIEREVIREPIKLLLDYIKKTTPVIKKLEETSEGHEESEGSETKEGLDISSSLSTDLTLQASLYGVLFQSYVDKEEWEVGLQAMDQALKDMPRTRHRLLIYKHRVMVKARLGLDVHVDIAKFRDESEDYVAHMWHRVALSSKETTQQLHCYQQAITSLTSSKFDWQKIDYLLEFSQWLYVNNFPIQDTIDQLEWAVDIVLQMERGVKKTDEEKKEANKKSKTSLKNKASKQQVMKSQEKMESVAGRASPSSCSTDEQTICAGDYIPVDHEAVIGTAPGVTPVALDDICDVRQLDTLFRVHVLTAEVVGQSSPHYTRYCLMAHSFLQAIWKLSMSESALAVKELSKISHETTTSPQSSAKSGKAKKGKDKSLAKEAMKEKPKRKGPLDHLPETTVDWSTYDIPDEVLDAFKHESMKTTGINSNSIVKPELTLHYANVLTDMLRHIGYHQLTLSILAYTDVFSRSLIKNNSLNMLIHLKAMRVCTELNLMAGLKFHEEIVGNIQISDIDQAASREQVAIYQEKRTQVKNEEVRIKKVMKSMSENLDITENLTPNSSGRDGRKKACEEVTLTSHLGHKLGDFKYAEVWTDIAVELISQGLYQSAMEYLTEAYTPAVAFEDKRQQAIILVQMAEIAYHGAQYGRATKLFFSSQETYNGMDMDWCETTLKMADCIVIDNTEKDRYNKVLNLLLHASSVFTSLAAVTPSRRSQLHRFMAKLEAKIASCQMSAILSEKPDINSPVIMKGLLSVVETYEHAIRQLLKCEEKREAIAVMKDHAAILLEMARHSTESEIIHTFYLQSMSVLKEAVSVSEDVVHDSLTLLSPAEIASPQNMSLTVQREMAEVQVLCAEVMLEIFDVHIHERRVEDIANERKGSVLRMVEEMERKETTSYTHMEREWKELTNAITDGALSYLMNAYHSASNIPYMKAKILYSIGKCVSLLATYTSPDRPTHWTLKQLEPLINEYQAIKSVELVETSTNTSVSNYTTRHSEKYTRRIMEHKVHEEMSSLMLMQATECLVQSLNFSLIHQFMDVASSASLELAELIGQYDPQSSSQLLALHQSCQASQYLQRTLTAALPDPATSRYAALLHQRAHLLRDAVTTNATVGNVWASVNHELSNNWQAWKRLSVCRNHLDMLKEFPSNFNFMILQHSPDKRSLYMVIMDRPKNTAVQRDKKSSAVHSRIHISQAAVDPAALKKIHVDYARYKQRTQHLLLQQEYKRAQYDQRQKMLAELGQSDIADTLSSVKTDSNEDELQIEFNDVIKSLEEYLQPLLSTIDLSTVITGKSSTHSDSAKDSIILLADPDLLTLPLEVTSCFHSPFITSLSRDFSLQMFYHRYHVNVPAEDASPANEKKKGASSKKENKEVHSRIPGMKDMAKKVGKLVPVNRQLQPGCQPVDTMNFRYIVDPYSDCVDTETQAPVEVFTKVLSEYDTQFTPRWLGILGQDHTPSVGEWEVYLNGASGFIFYGMERFLSYIPPAKILTLNLPDCMIVYILDHAQTSQSFSRQAKNDVFKSTEQMWMESPLQCAALLSLSGVRCVLSNQWNCSLADNSTRLNSSFKDLLESGQSTGEMMHLQHIPERRVLSPTTTDMNSVQTSPRLEAPQNVVPSRRNSQLTMNRKFSGVGPRSKVSDKVELKIDRKNYNLVCYGLPNLVITQI